MSWLVEPSHTEGASPCRTLVRPGIHKEKALHFREELSFKMVPKAGLEPARLTPLPPQDSVSTNSTTWANTVCLLLAGRGYRNFIGRLALLYGWHVRGSRHIGVSVCSRDIVYSGAGFYHGWNCVVSYR